MVLPLSPENRNGQKRDIGEKTGRTAGVKKKKKKKGYHELLEKISI